ncbi:MAG: HAD family hydrolase [Nocardioidaceae bacterium]|nr:HAD family hydrolase [Nocardioidaceae bacterium]NUS51614.1 HAD family hydrolase [Nocardioidaceae bacterium]
MTRTSEVDTVVLDVDGTLVDTVYLHTTAWVRAFADVGVVVPAWRVHRAIGMGGDRLVTEVAGEPTEAALGDEVRNRHGEHFEELINEARMLPGADELLETLMNRGFLVVLASSGEEEQTDRLLSLVDGAGRAHARTSSDEADRSKPAPDLVDAAIAKAGGERAAVVGDAVWDVEAARAQGRPAIGLLCGGFGAAELRDAGAETVFCDPADLVAHLDETVLAHAAATGAAR